MKPGKYFPSYFFGKVDRSARDGNNFLAGENIPADSSMVARHPVYKLEAAIDVRANGEQVPQWYEGNVAHFQVPTGGEGEQAAWDFTYSFLSDRLLARFNFELWVDRDPTEGTLYQVFRGQRSVDSIGLDWVSEDTDQFGWLDDDGDKYVTQNDLNIGMDVFRVGRFDYHDLNMGDFWEDVYERKLKRVENGEGNFLDHQLVDLVDGEVDRLNEGLPDSYDFGPGEFDIILRVETGLGTLRLENHAVVEIIGC